MAEYNQSQEFSGVLVPPPRQANEELPNGITKLMMAAYNGEASMVLELVSASPGLVNVENSQHGKALDYAVAGKQTKVIDILLGFGADLDAVDTDGQNLLHKCVLTKDLDKVKFCVELGANLNLQNKSGESALIIAAQNDLKDIVLYLLTIDCDINSVTTGGFTAKECAFFCNNLEICDIIERKREETENIDSEGGLSLAKECTNGNLEGVKNILNTHGNSVVEFRCSEFHNIPPLQMACQLYDESLASLLVSHGASVHTTSTMGYTPLTCAAIAGSDNLVQWLLRNGAHIHHRNIHGRTPLHCATIEGHFSVVKTLVENGIMLNVKCNEDLTALAIASNNGDTKIVEYLLEQGACVDIRDDNLNTPLISASKSFNTESAKCLLRYNANPNLVDSQALSPLMISAHTNNVFLTQALVEKGANVNLVNGCGHTALEIAVRCHSKEVQTYLSNLSRLPPQIPRRGVSVNHFQKDDIPLPEDTPQNKLLKICENGADSVSQLQSLNIQRIDINSRDSYGRTPLMISTINCHPNIVQWLVENGACIDATDSAGKTALMYAAEKGDVESVKILISLHADTLLRDIEDRDIFQIAEESQQDHVLNFFASCESSLCSNPDARNLHNAVKHLQYGKCKELINKGIDIN